MPGESGAEWAGDQMKIISAWFERQGGFRHIVAASYSFLILGYAVVPQFHSVVLTVWGHTPPFVRELGLAAAGLVALYRSKKLWSNPNAS